LFRIVKFADLAGIKSDRLLAYRCTRPLNVRLPFVKAGLFLDQNREMLPI